MMYVAMPECLMHIATYYTHLNFRVLYLSQIIVMKVLTVTLYASFLIWIITLPFVVIIYETS